MGAYFDLLVPHSQGFVTLPYTYLYHQIWLNPLKRNQKKRKKKTLVSRPPRAFFRFISNPFSFFVSAYFTCLSVFVCLLHCFFAVAPYCSPTSSCARSSERKNAQSGRRTAATPECHNHSTKASNRKQKTRKKNQDS